MGEPGVHHQHPKSSKLHYNIKEILEKNAAATPGVECR